MPAIRAGTELTLNQQYDVENCRDNSGKITRESVKAWLDKHAGDFQCVEDFHASIEDGDKTIDIPWATEAGELVYCDATNYLVFLYKGQLKENKMNELIEKILQIAGIPPDAEVLTDTGTTTAFNVMNNYIQSALDEIEEGQSDAV
jgi:hypothetical protein